MFVTMCSRVMGRLLFVLGLVVNVVIVGCVEGTRQPAHRDVFAKQVPAPRRPIPSQHREECLNTNTISWCGAQEKM